MTVCTYAIKEDDDVTIYTVRAETAVDADRIMKQKYPDKNIECIEYEDDEW